MRRDFVAFRVFSGPKRPGGDGNDPERYRRLIARLINLNIEFVLRRRRKPAVRNLTVRWHSTSYVV